MTDTLRVAFVGGANFESAPTEDFLVSLQTKYPDCTIVTGNGRGAEAHVREYASHLGMRLEVPELRPDWYGKAALDCQINDICLDYDALVIVGSPAGGRPKVALDIHKRIRWHVDNKFVTVWEPTHTIAEPPAKPKSIARRATKRQESLAA